MMQCQNCKELRLKLTKCEFIYVSEKYPQCILFAVSILQLCTMRTYVEALYFVSEGVLYVAFLTFLITRYISLIEFQKRNNANNIYG